MTTLVLGAKAEKGFKFVKMSLEIYWRKEIQKKEKGGRRCWANPPPFRPIQPRSPAPLPSPARGRARLTPPGAGHVAAVRRRRGRGRPAERLNPVGRPPRAPRRSTLSPPRSLSFPDRERSSSSSDRRGAIAGRAPPLTAGRVSEPFSAPRPPSCSPSPR